MMIVMAPPCVKTNKISSMSGRKMTKDKKSKMVTSKRTSNGTKEVSRSSVQRELCEQMQSHHEEEEEDSHVEMYDEEMDITKPLFPLSHYTNDPSELVDQVFLTMDRKGQLETILPGILKDLNLTELKQLCLQQLEVMSKKRIKRLLLGEEMESSSGTEEEEESENELEENEEDVQSGTTSQVADSTGLELTNEEQNLKLSEDAMECLESGEVLLELRPNSSEGEEQEEGEEEEDCEEKETLLTDLEFFQTMEPDENVSESDGGSNDDDDDETSANVMELGAGAAVSTPLTVQNIPLSEGSSTIAKTCLEILELELRARAIKSLLNSHPIPANYDS